MKKSAKKSSLPKAGRLACPGFRATGISCGIKKGKKKDLALIISDVPAVSAGVFTRNKVKAAPVVLDMKRLRRKHSRGVIINSGIANVSTGKKGMASAELMAKGVEDTLGLKAGEIFVASTGLIGGPLPVDKITSALGRLAKGLSPGGLSEAADAIMTTDAFPKTATVKGRVGANVVTITGIAKGAGMIRPDMATMLAFLMTDAAISKPALKASLKEAVDLSFNSISVDNDTSTNDTVLVFANGFAGGKEIAAGSRAHTAFTRMLTDLSIKLAKMIVSDGEGATKFIELRVAGAKSARDAKRAAVAISESMLVKTAFFGCDPNWGRIIAVLGRAGIALDPDKVDITFNGVTVARRGIDTGKEREAARKLKAKNIFVTVDLNIGKGAHTFWTTDLSCDYVLLNSAYTT